MTCLTHNGIIFPDPEMLALIFGFLLYSYHLSLINFSMIYPVDMTYPGNDKSTAKRQLNCNRIHPHEDDHPAY
jgi:hypothetical protein